MEMRGILSEVQSLGFAQTEPGGPNPPPGVPFLPPRFATRITIPLRRTAPPNAPTTPLQPLRVKTTGECSIGSAEMWYNEL